MNLAKLQEKFNKRTKILRRRKQEPIVIMPKTEFFTHQHDGCNAMFFKTQRHRKVGLMHGQK